MAIEKAASNMGEGRWQSPRGRPAAAAQTWRVAEIRKTRHGASVGATPQSEKRRSS